MSRIIDLNRYQKTYPLKRFPPIYRNADTLNVENQLLIPVNLIAGELYNLFTDNTLDEVWIDNFIISPQQKLFLINTNPFELNILKGDIIMNNTFNQGNISNLDDFNNDTIFNGWFNQGVSNINENTKYFDFYFNETSQNTDIVFIGISPE